MGMYRPDPCPRCVVKVARVWQRGDGRAEPADTHFLCRGGILRGTTTVVGSLRGGFPDTVGDLEPQGLSCHSLNWPQAQVAAEAEVAVLGQRRAAVEVTLRETQEENDEFRRCILGLEQQLKEARGLAEGGEVAEARLRDKVQRLEVSALCTSLASPWPSFSPLAQYSPAKSSAISFVLSPVCFYLPSQCNDKLGLIS